MDTAEGEPTHRRQPRHGIPCRQVPRRRTTRSGRSSSSRTARCTFRPEPETLQADHTACEHARDRRDTISQTVKAHADKAGMETRSWVVCCHNTPLGRAYPDTVERTAFGDPLYHNLCPSNEDVRAYSGRSSRTSPVTGSPRSNWKRCSSRDTRTANTMSARASRSVRSRSSFWACVSAMHARSGARRAQIDHRGGTEVRADNTRRVL